VHLHTLRSKEKKKKKQRWWWQTQLYRSREVYSGSSLLRDLSFQTVSGLYKHFIRMSPTEFQFIINYIREQISRKDTTFRKAIPVQERLALTLRFFLASGDSCVMKGRSCYGKLLSDSLFSEQPKSRGLTAWTQQINHLVRGPTAVPHKTKEG
jgi:hypothetical protein